MCQIGVIKKKERNGTNMSHSDIFFTDSPVSQSDRREEKVHFLKKNKIKIQKNITGQEDKGEFS